MPLTDHEKNQLWPDVVALVYAGEPEALLATLRRAAQRHAELVDQGVIDEPEAKRWLNLANALAQAELTIEHTNAPKSKQPPSKWNEAAIFDELRWQADPDAYRHDLLEHVAKLERYRAKQERQSSARQTSNQEMAHNDANPHAA